MQSHRKIGVGRGTACRSITVVHLLGSVSMSSQTSSVLSRELPFENSRQKIKYVLYR